MHNPSLRQDALRRQLGHAARMNALQQLIQDWIDGEPERSVRVLARRAGMPHNTIYAIMKRDAPAAPPQRATLERLATGLGVPLATVREAAVAAAGFRVEELDPDSRDAKGWMGLLGELPPEERDRLWDIGVSFLRRTKNT